MKSMEVGEITALAEQVGLKVFSVVNSFAPIPLAESRHKEWVTAGQHGEMSYLERAHSDLQCVFPPIRSALVFAVKYSSAKREVIPRGSGRVARYAWGKDYHRVLPKKIKAFVKLAETHMRAVINWKITSDATPLLEKAVAEQAGVGFIGKNSLIIRPGVGSYTLLAELLWDVEVNGVTLAARATGCGSCSRCVNACPTNAIVPEYSVDARKCISYLTIEKRGMLSTQERKMLGEWIFGCDICQEVCPFNSATALRNPQPELEEFSAERGAGQSLRLLEILQIKNDEEYLKRFAGSPLMRAKREGLVRNAICVAVNTDFLESRNTIFDLASSDPSPVVRSHAIWAIAEFAAKHGNQPQARSLAATSFYDGLVATEVKNLVDDGLL